MRNRRPYKKPLTLNKENKKFLGVCAGVADYLEVEAWSVRLVFMVSMIFGGWFLVPMYFIAWFCLDDKAGEGLGNLAEAQPLKHFRTVDYGKKLYRNTEEGKFLGVCAGVADYLEVNVFAVRLFFMCLVFFTAALPIFLYVGAYFILEEKPHARMTREERKQRRRYRSDASETVREAARNGARAGMAAFEEMASQFKGGADGAATTKAADATNTTNLKRRKAKRNADTGDDTVDASSFSKRREFKYCARKFSNLHNRLAKMEAYVTSSQFRLHREFKNI